VEGDVGSSWSDRDGWNYIGFEKAMFGRPSPVALFSAEGMGVLCTNVPGRELPRRRYASKYASMRALGGIMLSQGIQAARAHASALHSRHVQR
jgi:hypothetical protein